jgi:hypothetical protein
VLAATALAAAVITGCDNGSKLSGVNNNPNAPITAPVSTVFPNAVETGVGDWLGAGYDLRDISLIIQHMAENQYIGNDQYKGVDGSTLNGNWTNAYDNDLKDFQYVYSTGLADKDPSVWAPASIMQQWEFGYLTDTWGDIPYSQALAGDSTKPVLQPTYDTQQAIYQSFFTKLSAAAAALTGNTTSTLGGADPIYNDDAAKWQKFANSLHARDAMRIVNADPATADAELKAAFSGPGGVFTSNADNAQLDWPGDNIFNNPWAVNFSSRDDDRMSKTLIDTLSHYNDPRIAVYAMPAEATGTYRGQPNGLTNATAVAYSDSASRAGAFFYPGPVAYGSGFYGGTGGAQPSYLMTYAELALIQAEAAERGLGGLNPAQAAAFYNAGITASMNQWGITDATAIATYLAQPEVAYKGGVAGLKQIALQKWIALYSDGGQAWFEWRRTCTPQLALPQVAIFSYVPRRIQYPASESSTNGANVATATADMGGNANNTMMWEDKPSAAPTCQ